MNTLRVKPGYKTSEFWVTLASFIFSGAYLVGLLDSNSQKEDLITESSRGVEAIILIIGQLTVLFRYVKGRSDIKKIWWNNNLKETEKVEPVTPEPEPKPKRKAKPKTKKPKPKGHQK